MNLSFAGCGYLGIYHVGVATCFRQYAPHVLDNKITGASVGALIACGMMLNVPLGISTNDVLRISLKARSRALGPFHPGFEIIPLLREGIFNMLPEDAHIRCSGKLHISVTRVSDGENVLLNKFDSNDELIQALMCSCFIPVYCGLIPPKFHGVGYMDGGFSDNQPVLDDDTITVAPFCGESDICPLDSSFSIMQINLANTSISVTPSNMYRFARILFPGHPEMLSDLCQQGFDDALRFLQTKNMVSCTRCLAVQSSFLVSQKSESTTDDSSSTSASDSDPDCQAADVIDHKPCRHSSLQNMPEAVVKVLNDTCDQMNKGIINWLFRHRSVKLLSILSLPCVLPIDIAIVCVCKIWQMMPKLQSKLNIYQSLIRHLLSKLRHRKEYSAKLSCQLAVMEFDYTTKTSQYKKVSRQKVSEKNRTENTLAVNESHFNKVPQDSIGFATATSSPAQDNRDPERVISNVKFDLTLDLPVDHDSSKSKRHKVMEALKNLGGPEHGVNAVGVANKALSWKRQGISSYGEVSSQQTGPLEKILDMTSKQEALMSFYYMDDDMKVKVTEIFNISDKSSSSQMTETSSFPRRPNGKEFLPPVTSSESWNEPNTRGTQQTNSESEKDCNIINNESSLFQRQRSFVKVSDR